MRRALSALLALGLLGLLGCAHATSISPPPVTTLTVVPDEPIGSEPLLRADAALATSAGAGALRLVEAGYVQEGDRIGGFVEIPAGECALAFARGTDGLVEVDLLSFEDSGDVYVSDESTGPEGTVLICPPHPRRLYLQARAVAGAGRLALGVQPVAPEASVAVAKATQARGLAGTDSGRYGAVWAGLEARIAERRRALGSRWVDVRRAALPLDPRAPTRMSLTVSAGRCLDAFLSPGEDVGVIDVAVEDAEGRIVATAAALGRDRAALLCSSVAMELTLSVRSRVTQGLVAVVLSESDPGAVAELRDPVILGESRDLPASRRAWDEARAAEGAGPPKALASGAARVGELHVQPVELPAGCARIDVLAGSPLVGVRAVLWDAAGARLAASSGGRVASLFDCGVAPRRARLDVEALARPGPFAVELRAEPAAPAPLIEQPLAGARILDRALASGLAASLSGYLVMKFDLAAGRRVDVPINLPKGTCVQVIAALGPGARGLNMDLRAGSSGRLSRSREVVADRLCSGDGGPLSASAELSVDVGQTTALISVVPAAP